MNRLLALLWLASVPALALESLDDNSLRDAQARDGLSVKLEWRLNADANGDPLAGAANSIPFQSAGQSEFLIFHKNTGKFVADEIRFDVADTPAALGTVTKKAMKVTIPGPLIFTKWKIDEISIGAAASSLPADAGYIGGKIVGFETNATFRFGATTAAYLFDYTPP